MNIKNKKIPKELVKTLYKAISNIENEEEWQDMQDELKLLEYLIEEFAK